MADPATEALALIGSNAGAHSSFDVAGAARRAIQDIYALRIGFAAETARADKLDAENAWLRALMHGDGNA